MFHRQICYRFGSFPPFSLYNSLLFALNFLYLFIYSFIFCSCFLTFILSLFQSVGVAGVCMLCMSQPSTQRVMTWHGTPYYCCLHHLLPVSYFCDHRACISRAKNQRGHWLCWMSTSRKNSLMRSTHICSSTYLFQKRQEYQLGFFGGKRLNRVYPGRTTTYQGTLCIQALHARTRPWHNTA